MAVATKAAVAGGAGLVLVVVIVVIVVVLLQLQKQTPAPTAPVVQAPALSPAPSPTPTPAPTPAPSPTPVPVYSGPQSSLSVAGPAPAPIIQQIGLTAPPAEQGQVAALLDSLPDILTSIVLGLAVEALLRADVIAFKIATRMRMTPAIALELKAARARVAAKTFSGRMSKAFGRMGTLARAKMGMRWGKTATQLGETVDSSTARLIAEAAQANIDNGARLAATRIAERQAAGATLKSVSFAFDAAAIVGLALDMTNTGNYTELMSTSDMRTMKIANESQVVNTTIACSTWPLGAGCPQTASPAPAPAPAPGPAPPPRAGRYPMFVGPLDEWDADVLDLAISNEFVKIFTSSDPPQSVKYLIADVSSRISSDLEVDTISDTLFIMLCNQYLTSTELDNIHNLALDNICTSEGGVGFVPGNGYDKMCSYKTMDDCHAAFPWPPPDNDDRDMTYTEWRTKPWFSSGDWTNTITQANIPPNGACIAADPSIHQLCDEEIATGTGRARNQYVRETGECVNTRDVCRVKGVSYRDSDPPTCYVAEGQELAELLFGSTIVRFLMSNGKLSLDPDLITTVVTVTIPPVNSGNSTVDTAVNTVSSGLASAAAEIANAGIIAANEIQAGLVDAANDAVNIAADVVRELIPVVVEITEFVMDFDRGPLVVTDPITAEVTVNVPTVSTGSAPVDEAVNTVSSGLASAAAEISNAGIDAANALQTGGATAVNTVVDFAADVVAGTVVVVLPALADVGTQVAVYSAGTQGSTLAAALSGSAAGLTEGGYADLSNLLNMVTAPLISRPQPWDHPATPKPPGVSDAILPTVTPASGGVCPSGSTNGYDVGGYDSLSCLSCPPGYTLSGGNGDAVWCYKCPPNSNWVNSTVGCSSTLRSPTVTPASGSNYVNGRCPAGATNIGEDYSRPCVSCPAGSTLKMRGNSAECRSCEAGYSLSSDGSSCVPNPTTCPANQYLSGSQCVGCPVGTAKATTGTSQSECIPTTCPANQYLSGSQCVACPTNTSKATTGTSRSECIPTTCPANQYLSGSQCVACPTNTSKATTGTSRSECIALSCPVNQYVSNHQCVNCPSGQVSAGGSASSCISCNNGQYVYNNQCVTCPDGKGVVNNVCTPCPAGEAGTRGICIQCYPGTYTDTTGQTSCKACAGGTYSSSRGATSCTACPAGKYSVVGNTSCSYCPVDTYSTGSASSCTACPTGTNSPSKSTSASACVAPPVVPKTPTCPNGGTLGTTPLGESRCIQSVGSRLSGARCPTTPTGYWTQYLVGQNSVFCKGAVVYI
jgi:hypothetical protein